MTTFERLQLIKVMITQLHVNQIEQINCNRLKNLSKQQKVDTDPKAMQQINLTGNLNRPDIVTMPFIAEEKKETVLRYSKGTLKVLRIYFVLIQHNMVLI